MMSKRICLIMSVIIIKGDNVNDASLMMSKKNSLDNDCHHQKGGECECMNTWFWWCLRRSNKVASKDKHCFKINTRLLQQTKPCFKINSRSSLASKQSVSKTSKALVIDYEAV